MKTYLAIGYHNDDDQIMISSYYSISELIQSEIEKNENGLFALQSFVRDLSKNENFVKALKINGFTRISEIKDRETKIKAGKLFFIINKHNRARLLNDLDEKNIKENLEDIVKGRLVQDIDESSFKTLAPKIHEKYLKLKSKMTAK